MSVLRAGAADAAIIVCNTCRPRGWDRDRRGGALLYEALERVKAREGLSHLAVEPMGCLWACGQACTVHIRAAGKIAYTLGNLAPTEDAADALLRFFQAYLDSEDGTVPFKAWPEGVKNHFLCRQPPVGKTVLPGG